MAELVTIPAYLLRNGTDGGYANAPAIREKDLGIWRTYTWSDYLDNVRDFSLGLASLGFGANDKLSVIGNNRPRLYWGQFAAMCLGGQAVPVYHEAIATEMSFVLAHSEVAVIVAVDQEQVDKVLEIRDQLPNLKWLIYDYPRGLLRYDEDILKSFEEVQALGRDFGAKNQGYFEDAVAKVQPDDVALINYTSGTTGSPKGVLLSHANFVRTTQAYLDAEDVRMSDDFLAYLPLAWVGETLYGTCVSLMSGCATNCPESPETLQRDLREIGPTGMIGAPRVWEGMLSTLQVRASDSSPLKQWVFNYFQDVAMEVEAARAEGRPVSGGLGLKHAIGEFMVYGPLRDQLGLRRARWCLTGGAPLGPDVFRFFRGIGINLKQVYGMTEMTGLVSVQPDGLANSDTVGPPCKGIEIKVDEGNSELLVRSAGIFTGYFKEEEKTKEVLTDDGWYRTGDAGLLNENGHLVVIDRAKDVGKLSDGTPFAPQFIELKLKYSPYINEVVAFGDGHPYVTAMIAIDFEAAGNWADKSNLPYTNYVDLSSKDVVRDLIAEEVRKINIGIPEVSRVKRFLLLTKDLDADDNEVTRTRKLRRSFIAEKYGPVVEAFYGGAQNVDLKLDVTFEDGSRSQVDSHLTIQDAA
jgi:long-chain acyl-CoA synthetase